MNRNSKCGFCGIFPKCLQNLATSRSFIAVYGLLGTVQSMAFIYIVVSLTTLEKRFKIPSRTTGIILSGNEISQILSILLIYYGGSGHRPRWIAVGVGCSAISCLVLALPHVIYGPGQDALALTKEHLNSSLLADDLAGRKSNLPTCSNDSRPESCDVDGLTDTSVAPRLLVFFSQFILGIGTTLYYGLGQTYMDDNTKKKNTPMLLGFTFALRTVGPALGFVLGYICLNIYIDPSLHPIIDKKDPRWLGAWWLGWIILGITMAIFAVLLAMFPRELQKSKKSSREDEYLSESEVPLKIGSTRNSKKSEETRRSIQPSLKEFPKTIKRILMNKLLMLNIFSGVFYVLSASSFMNFISKYLEVQFETSPGEGTIITGPLTLLGMVLGFLISGIVIGKFKPSARPLLFWNVIVGLCYFFGQIAFMFLGCGSGTIEGLNFDTLKMNLTTPCNVACNCELVKYAPVCHEATKTTFISACHAGCRSVINDTSFGDCACIPAIVSPSNVKQSASDVVIAGPCKENCFQPYMLFSIVSTFINILGCSGRIGNVLLNYRCVETRDKSLAQGIALLVVSLFALIPGPIIFGAIMDSTCLVWDTSCKNRGNCWFYHRDNFRYYINLTAACMCLVGVFFDLIVCYLSKGIDLYGDNDEVDKKTITSQVHNDLKLNNQEDNSPKQL
ncbi:PREDICTED: solute carrier organic anion transporter family member 5A1 [Ceratosolen solmsi marchali]|uniref:Solute carrier organic anion transporter family member n=1 Tax=Ceratosolen solmsi marchali TaxID=326594 RepID=A0AAJ6YLV3_9HYME|nr:PREDICTED: solute carrier organic anion transporter family member 5A1 [Ceratosolen solmsi marchali]